MNRVQSHCDMIPDYRVVIFGEGQPQHVFNWFLDSFSVLPSPQIDFICGGQIEVPTTASISAKISTYICYSNMVFRRNVIKKMEDCKSNIVLAIDTTWRKEPETESRFIGLIKVSGDSLPLIQEVVKFLICSKDVKLSEIVQILFKKGVSLSMVDCAGDWTKLDAPHDLAKFILGTKAESLDRIRPLLKKSRIEPLFFFTSFEWEQYPEEVINRIEYFFTNTSIIVRSSALKEDNWNQSSAGVFKSVLNVPSADRASIKAAIQDVITSYKCNSPKNQVLVQEMLSGHVMSGVVMTRTPTLGAPYYVINFDDSTLRTDSVTSGSTKSIRTIYLHRVAKTKEHMSLELFNLIEAVNEIEHLVGHDSLDVEFAIKKDGSVNIMQVRPIGAVHRNVPIDDFKIFDAIRTSAKYFNELQRPSPFLVGDSTMFSVMTDWNPAEMIGIKPNRLAFSLYRYLITDELWARQRAEYGYRDVRPANLIVDFIGHPYVDIRVDFNSFIPAALSDDLAARLANYYIDKLKKKPNLHDKVEFEILYTCITFDFDKRAQELYDAGFSEKEVGLIKNSLLEITHNGIARCENDLDQIKVIEERYKEIAEIDFQPLEAAYLLLEDVRNYGVLCFSHLARNAFVAVTLLNSLESIGCVSKEQIQSFYDSIRTVPKRMQEDAIRVTNKEMVWEDYVKKYAHLRPGTYNIASPTYGKAPEEFLRPVLNADIAKERNKKHAVWDERTQQNIGAKLRRIGLNINIDRFEHFLRSAIEGREVSKFVFTKGLSFVLEAIAKFGRNHNVPREELAQIKICDLFKLRSNTVDIKHELKRLAKIGEEDYNITQAVYLPNLIFSETDFVCSEKFNAEPNFVTQRKVRGQIALLDNDIGMAKDLTGKIVVIPSADPGYDWLFSKRIAGLVTMYGGVNSHMSVRSAELKLPAAIGVGEVLFEKIIRASVIELDCTSNLIRTIC